MEDLCVGDKTIVPSFPEIDPIDNPTVEYVGPIDSNFLQYKSNHSFKDNYILVYPGRLRDSAGDTGIKIVEKVINASRQLPDQEFILATNESLTALSSEIHENVKVVPSFTTHMLQNASLFIHHGGHGSCLSSIKYRVPSLILPTHSERYFNAKRISQLGVGDYLLPDMVTDDHFIKMLKYMIGDPSYSANLRDYNIEIASRKYKGERRAFDIANSILKRKQKRESK
nr:nucleotide disphospho-sugar-binding domain-containing protein [Fictibacillus marinisediminis]